MQMPGPDAFIDSNILLYLLSADADKADRAESIARAGGMISVQVLNEIASVARRKLFMSWEDTGELLALIRSLCPVEPLTVATHDKSMLLAQRYRLSIYDAMIAATAFLGGCKILYSEDMHDGLLIEKKLRIRNPFRPTT
jgi:predicted nucleic acid-binding protein